MLQRKWFNQPSTLQDYHKLHGVKVLVQEQPGRSVVQVWFLSGDVVSMEVPPGVLSDGW